MTKLQSGPNTNDALLEQIAVVCEHAGSRDPLPNV